MWCSCTAWHHHKIEVIHPKYLCLYRNLLLLSNIFLAIFLIDRLADAYKRFSAVKTDHYVSIFYCLYSVCQQFTNVLCWEKKQTSSHCMCTLYYIQATITRNIQSSSVAIFMQREKGDEDMGVPYGFLFYSALRPFSDSQIIGTGMLYRPHLMTHLMVIR